MSKVIRAVFQSEREKERAGKLDTEISKKKNGTFAHKNIEMLYNRQTGSKNHSLGKTM